MFEVLMTVRAHFCKIDASACMFEVLVTVRAHFGKIDGRALACTSLRWRRGEIDGPVLEQVGGRSFARLTVGCYGVQCGAPFLGFCLGLFEVLAHFYEIGGSSVRVAGVSGVQAGVVLYQYKLRTLYINMWWLIPSCLVQTGCSKHLFAERASTSRRPSRGDAGRAGSHGARAAAGRRSQTRRGRRRAGGGAAGGGGDHLRLCGGGAVGSENSACGSG